MSLALDVDNIRSVLLADGWHTVSGKSFDLDSYEYICNGQLRHGGGQCEICAVGFVFQNERNELMAGPLTSVLAVKSERASPESRRR